MNIEVKAPAVSLLAPGLVEEDFTICGAVTTQTVRMAREAVEALVDPESSVKLLVNCIGVKKFSYLPSEKLERPPQYHTEKLVFLTGPGEGQLVERLRSILPDDYESRVMEDRQAAIAWLMA